MRVCTLLGALVILAGPSALAQFDARRQARASSSSRISVPDVSPLETRVFGPSRWIRGAAAALRIAVSDHRSRQPIRANVGITVTPAKDSSALANSRVVYVAGTDSLGIADTRIQTASLIPGTYRLYIRVDSPIGSDEVFQDIRVEESARVMLTADKPVYQPGQVIHLRVLALDAGSLKPAAGQIVFEAEDARSNKVFKKRETLSYFGVASVDFALADEVNMGVYTLRAVLAGSSTEKKVRVERYTLPKYRITIKAEKPYYQPGDLLKAVIQADYFFGKPVAAARVDSGLRVGDSPIAELQGRTDSSGAYKLEFRIPRSLSVTGRTTLQIHARLKDTADQVQEAKTSTALVKEALQILVVPERAPLAAGVANRVYVAVAAPDGAPVRRAAITVWADGIERSLITDSAGIDSFDLVPDAGNVDMTLRAASTNGRSVIVHKRLVAGGDGLLLRSDRSLVKPGEVITLTALSPNRDAGMVYFDVVRGGHTLTTRAQPIANGQASTRITASPEMAGTVLVTAYRILENEQIVRDTRRVVVLPARDLRIDVAADQPVYRPGAEATLRFTVKDPTEMPVAAALGIAVVDESVFSMTELQPGLEKVFFALEGDLLTPRYDIHGLSATELIQESGLTDSERQRAAALVLAASTPKADYGFQINTYKARWEKVKAVAQAQIDRDYARITDALRDYYRSRELPITAERGLSMLVERGFLRPDDLLDPWSTPYRVDFQGSNQFLGWCTLLSAGPDHRWQTLDDLSAGRMLGFGRAGGMMGGRGGFGGGGLGGGGFGGGFRGGAGPGLTGGGGARGGIGYDLDNSIVTVGANDAAAELKSRITPEQLTAPEPRVREFFPETMYWNPALITDERGHAELRIPLADSITTWSMSVTGSSAGGRLGGVAASLRAFQDFFVDIDLPLALTQNDRVEIPVAVYNYHSDPQQVELALEQQPWFALQGESRRTVSLEKNQVRVVYFPITANEIGRHALSVTAKGGRLADAVRRGIDILPDGQEREITIGGRVEKSAERVVRFPDFSIPEARSLWLKLYPGALSQVIEGLDGILRMPYGCFEQSSSATYPDVLVLQYLKEAGRLNPEILAKAHGYINIGYQRLVTFEVPGGGFSLYGQAPASQTLTAYGLLEFADMAKVHEVDPALIKRTQEWLAKRQASDGSWDEGTGFAHSVAGGVLSPVRSTAFIAWALIESGYQGPQIDRALRYLKSHFADVKDPYTLALVLNPMAREEPDGDQTARVASMLIEMARVEDDAAYWHSNFATFTGAREYGADLETSALAAYALARWGRQPGFTDKALNFLVRSRGSYGAWSSTQATVWAMKSLLFAGGAGARGRKGTITVFADGAKVATIALSPEDSEVMRQIDLAEHIHGPETRIRLQYSGEGSIFYQIAGRYYAPWGHPEPKPPAPLTIQLDYDKSTLARDETTTATATVKNVSDRVIDMPLIDLGVPPGFSVVQEGLENAVKDGRISKFSVAARQIILYLEKLDPGQSVTVTYSLKARLPLKAQTPMSKAYPYYNPEQATYSPPQTLTIHQ